MKHENFPEYEYLNDLASRREAAVRKLGRYAALLDESSRGYNESICELMQINAEIERIEHIQ